MTEEVEFLIVGPGLPSSKQSWGDLMEVHLGPGFENKILIVRPGQVAGGVPYLLVAGYKRSEAYPSDRISAILVEPIRDEVGRKKLEEHLKYIGLKVVFFE